MLAPLHVEELLNSARVAIANGLAVPEIASDLAEYGYMEVRIGEGQVLLYDAALAAQQRQQVEFSEQIGATERLNGAIEADAEQEKEKSEAQQATRERDAAVDALDEWLKTASSAPSNPAAPNSSKPSSPTIPSSAFPSKLYAVG
ncbi:hypothetical protein [Synechococcus sp. PCC 7336]|uniref:hypothetical protein n=1 Tax=Synechococcus sp. PCC 7336 TaxID=195250 RepID=UPI00034BD753|nr:hypothetical protein [Synechococcus sp. PCC 7336]